MNAFLEGPDGRRIELRDGFVIGRVAGCDLVIGDAKASRRHAKLAVVGSVVEIEDLDSHNGTLLNGKPVKKRVLRDGDEIGIGATVLRFREGVAAPGVPAGAPKAGEPRADEPGEGELDLELGTAPPRNAPPPPPPRHQAPLPRPNPAAAPPPPAAPAPAGDVLEFVDEVVQLRADQPAKPSGARAAGPGVAARGDSGARQGGVLQFQAKRNQSSIKGPLGDDLAQMSLGMRFVWLLVGLGLMAGVGWLVMTLVA